MNFNISTHQGLNKFSDFRVTTYQERTKMTSDNYEIL